MAQDVSAAWTAEERDSVRNIAHNLQVSWKKESSLGNRTFTIGVSLIGGDDVIGINPGAIGSPGNYKYFDETSNVMGLSWEKSLNLPYGGLSVGFAEAELDNTSKRYLPDYMGGVSELYTAILPRRPFIINAGFDFDGIDQTIPQFSGILKTVPNINVRQRLAQLNGADYVDFFSNRYLDQELMFTGFTTDQVYEQLLQSMGLSTAQYSLDPGINIIPFGLFEKGTKYSDIFHDLAAAENGQFYQDEQGIFRFENRQHWDSSPHTEVQRVITTGQVIDSELFNEDHIINVVEVKSDVRSKDVEQQIFKLSGTIEFPVAENVEVFVQFDNPILQVTSVNITANTSETSDGTDISTSVQIKAQDEFSQAMKLVLYNRGTTSGFITDIVVTGRPVRVSENVYVRAIDDSSVTAYEERPLVIENKFISSQSWANSLAQIILNDYSEPENLIRLTIRAIPELQLGDLISWQGRYWRVYGLKAKLNPSYGFVQELLLVQRDVVSYFRIGISLIGGEDQIAP